MSESIFTKIINRELPGHIIYEDELCVAILDIFPTMKGQSLIIPKKEIDYIFDLDDETYSHLFKIAKKVAQTLDATLQPKRTCLVVEGLDVPHVHIKIYPLQEESGPLGKNMNLGEKADDKDLAVLATQISAALSEA